MVTDYELCDQVPSFIRQTLDEIQIFIDRRLNEYQKKILCAHELGHYYTESLPELSLFDPTLDIKSETKANLYVAYLMPQILYPKKLADYENLNNEEIMMELNMLIANKAAPRYGYPET